MDIVNDIISRLEGTVYPVVSPYLRNIILDMISFQLKGDILSLTPLKRQILIESLLQRYNEAHIQEFEPVGVNAALTVGENMTQSSLSAKHHAGLKRGAKGFDRIEEITNMKNKSNIVNVITTPINGVPRSKFEINNLANLLAKIWIHDIMVDFKIVDITPQTSTTTTIGESSRESLYPSWYKVFAKIKGMPLMTLKSRWIRIFFNPAVMYKHRISLPVIGYVISEHLGMEGRVLYPPSTVGLFIDVHLDVITESNYYKRIGDIASLLIQGIDSVESASPIPENLLTDLRIIQMQDNGANTSGRYVYELVSGAPVFVPSFAWEQMIKAMIPDAQMIGNTGKRFSSSRSLGNIREMILQCPLIYADVIDTRKKITIGEEYYRENPNIRYTGERPTEAVKITFKQELINKYPYLEYADLEPRIFLTDEEANKFLLEVMVEYHFFWYIEAVCERVQDLYVLPEVDPTRTYTISALDCKETLGYLTMRKMMYQELKDNIGIDPVHIKVIVNNMTLYKEPVSIRRQSVRNDKSEWMTYTTFEDVQKYLTFATFAGEEDHMQSVSSRVLTGSYIKVGRGGVNMKPTSKENPTGNKFLQLKLDDEERRKKQQEANTIVPAPARGRGISRGVTRGRGGNPTRGRGRTVSQGTTNISIQA